MKQSIERELKFLVNQKTFESARMKAEKMCESFESFNQVNYFYDTANQFWHKHDVTIRIRKIGNKYLLQTKQRTKQDRVRLEIEKEIGKLPKQIELSKEFVQINRHQYKLIELQGALITQRTSFYCENNVRIDFDINYYLGNKDYEIEIEYPERLSEAAKQIALQLVDKDGHSQVIGKRIRFYNAKKLS